MARMSLIRFLQEQWTNIPKPSTPAERDGELEGHGIRKTIVVTGATSGLGLEAAKQFHQLPSSIVGKLILSNRDTRKVVEAEKFVTAGSINRSRCQWSSLDLASFRSVTAFVDNLGSVEEVNCFIANAALATHKFTQTGDGWESALQVNYLSNALLSILLLPNLIQASTTSGVPSRLVFISSDVHYSLPSRAVDAFRNAPNIIEAVSRKEYCTSSVMKQRTMLSKFFIVAFARELASRLAPSPPSSSPPIIISSLNPGFCHSNLTRETESHFPGNLWLPLLKAAVARPSEVGGSVLVRGTLMLGKDDSLYSVKRESSDGNATSWHGRYLSSCLQVLEESDLLLGEAGTELSRKIWDDTITILKRLDPRVEDILVQYTVATTKGGSPAISEPDV
ncbi:hypothetical protein GYMLUDRAFT_71648 [Collybiopsis luxurians FD-317 M1]|uniref:Short-chain dehydrogenase n=1 Tax=Collybiopsis luxurians FD-317 M1 TaxID=944289 RepID=A0A0D0CMB2_9AGAR|nr:hypothetical protein GYMLUDRAFT_71648 [Collybiopsis luxurians FD-317 M1]